MNPRINLIVDEALDIDSKEKLKIFLENWMGDSIKNELFDLVNLNTKDYYVTTQEGSDYHVWKCIDNNSNTASNSQPLYSDVSGSLSSLYIKSAADGYQWRFMYTMPQATYNKFTSNNYIPVVAHANAVANAINGAIDQYFVSNSGNNYNEFANGSVVSSTNTTLFKINSTDFTLSGINDFYNNCSIYFTAGVANGEISKISDYVSNSSGKFVTIARTNKNKINISVIINITSANTIEPA